MTSPATTAALAGLHLAEAESALRRLHDRHLLLQRMPGRYQYHDAVRAYAHRLLGQYDPASGQDAALVRLLHCHRYAAALAASHMYGRWDRLPVVPAPDTPIPPIADDRDAAQAWLAAERPNLVTVAVHAAGHGHLYHTATLSVLIWHHLFQGGHWHDAEVLLVRASDSDNTQARAEVLTRLGSVRYGMGDNGQALEHWQEALDGFRIAGDRIGEGHVLSHLGLAYARLGNHDESLHHHQQALDALREAGDRYGQFKALMNLGGLHMQRGHFETAIAHCRQALDAVRPLGDQLLEGRALSSLGFAYLRAGRSHEALDCCGTVLKVQRDLGDRFTECNTLNNIGCACRQLGRLDAAAGHHRQALEIARDIGYREVECEALNELGTTMRLLGRRDQAMDHHQAALVLANESGDRYQRAQGGGRNRPATSGGRRSRDRDRPLEAGAGRIPQDRRARGG
jgi:tetratricopeptide (TPR) repeat protein